MEFNPLRNVSEIIEKNQEILEVHLGTGEDHDKVIWGEIEQKLKEEVKEMVSEKEREAVTETIMTEADSAEENTLGQENDEIEEKVAESDAEEEKTWLFKENIRIQAEQKALEEEKKQFHKEMREWTTRIQYEKQRLDQERHFFDKKFKILESGFKQLNADKAAWEKSKVKQKQPRYFEKDFNLEGQAVYFTGVTSPLGLKKRYKDLIKIYHPDNLFGDNETILRITREYEEMKKIMQIQKKA